MFHFCSYKLSRLLMPHALLALAVASLWLPGLWAGIFVALQMLFYGLAIANPLIPQGWILKRLSSPIFTFSLLMVASLCAASVLVVDPRRLWKVTRVGVPATSAAKADR
jgi:hypothetical protein